MSKDELEVSELASAIAGAGGGALSMTLTYPLLTITTKLQAEEKVSQQENREKRSATDVIRELFKEHGITGFYNGLESAIYGMTITNFVYYYFYEWATNSVKRICLHNRLSTLESMFTGAVAGSATVIASNPIWVANTRMTVTKSHKSTLATIMEIVEKDGFFTLFSGVRPALLLVINPIIQYTTFEKLKNLVLSNSKSDREILPPGWAFLFGAIGKLLATGLTYPYITIKTRRHLEKQNKSGNGDSLFQVAKREGVSGLYNGISYKLTQSILTAAFLFYFKEGLTSWAVRMLKFIRQLLLRRSKITVKLNE
ncbi:hypothetical protein ZYGR_0E01070 [Zygosaccharomyces rouxii]|uniref:ZYRO0B02354p n=2 Tax=Zygosaccharomyces rouxii TaxID=4956 RepID=C5DQR3_ZYGRC|nr:uncharacterized protein ZYRO0B02354g [Zygosaccharomyces rouxii]KAH9200326.1 mitochondrial carrier domain-containing protein [Zygosaccharomyces rouxii]GAV47092.1 hypothetical protein ZYGR_0E01070 [Zygosaccharomyces rouxii]CAR26124.1 ZYRO0B02354p [Zygosaccharomyces rouxii]